MVIRFFGLAFILLCTVAPALADDCKPLTDQTKQSVISYISKRLRLPNASTISVSKQEFMPGSCYVKFTITGDSLSKPLILFLSPDQRFLSTSLLDTTLDPDQEGREEAERNKALLSEEGSPRRGNVDAKVTIVEFSDFECPYCKQFADWINALPRRAPFTNPNRLQKFPSCNAPLGS